MTKISTCTNLTAVVVLTCTAVPLAHAQSSVTLYGIVDNGPAYVSNEGGHRFFGLLDGQNPGDRFGMVGKEDLGGGTVAEFVLENGFNSNTGALGQGGRMFGRQAYVGLNNTSMGKIDLGRQYDTNYDYLATVESAKIFSGNGAHVSDNDNLFGTTRFQNSVKYTSPKFAGFSFAALYAFSGAAGNTGNNEAFSGTIGYNSGGLRAAIGYLQMDHPNAASNPTGAVGNDYPAPAGLFLNSIVHPTVTAARQSVYDAGGSYKAGNAVIGLLYSRVKITYQDSSTLALSNYEANAYYNFTPALMLGGGYTFTSGKYDVVDREPRWHEINLGGTYSLSKRTQLYVFGVLQRATGGARAAIFGVPASSNHSQAEIAMGVRHVF